MSTKIDSISERLVHEAMFFAIPILILAQDSDNPQEQQHAASLLRANKLDAASSEVNFNTGNSETAIICVAGEAELRLVKTSFHWANTMPLIFPGDRR